MNEFRLGKIFKQLYALLLLKNRGSSANRRSVFYRWRVATSSPDTSWSYGVVVRISCFRLVVADQLWTIRIV